MFTITLEVADNGIIKTIEDNNINGAGAHLSKRELYVLDDNINNTKDFISDIINDLGVFTGHKRSNKTIHLIEDWGDDYVPSEEELNKRQKEYTDKLNKYAERL